MIFSYRMVSKVKCREIFPWEEIPISFKKRVSLLMNFGNGFFGLWLNMIPNSHELGIPFMGKAYNEYILVS